MSDQQREIYHSENGDRWLPFAENHVPVGGAPGLLGAPRVPSRIPMQPHEPRKSGDENHARRNASDGRSRPVGLLRRLQVRARGGVGISMVGADPDSDVAAGFLFRLLWDGSQTPIDS